MDIKEKISDTIEKIVKDDDLREQFGKDPIKAIEKVLGVDLPDDIVEKIVDGVKAKLTADKLGDALGALKKLF